MKKRNQLLVVSLTTLLFAVPAAAQVIEAKSQKHAEDAAENRQSLFTLLKDNMGPLGAMAKGKRPYDKQVLETNSLRLQQLGDMLHDYLQVDTRKFDVHTHAKPELWDNFSEVEAKVNDFQSAAKNLNDVVAAGDESRYKKAIAQVGGACKACHDDFKED